MAIKRVHLVLGPRTRVVPVRVEGGKVNSKIIGRKLKPGEQLLGVIGHYRGVLTPEKADQILKGRIDAILAAHASEIKVPEIKVPEMLAVSDKLNIMRKEVTVGLFKQVMRGYKIEGHNADKLQAILNDHFQTRYSPRYVSLWDAREFAKRLSALTGRKFRVVTGPEWDIAKSKVGKKMSGEYPHWTETEMGHPGSGIYFLRSLIDDGDHNYEGPGRRPECSSIRLVEDK